MQPDLYEGEAMVKPPAVFFAGLYALGAAALSTTSNGRGSAA